VTGSFGLQSGISGTFAKATGSIVSMSGTFTGSVTGNLLGSSSYAISASWAPGGDSQASISSSWASSSVSSSYTITASYALGSVTNFSTGTYTGSFTGNFLGSSSYALSASWAPDQTDLTNYALISGVTGSFGLQSGISGTFAKATGSIVSMSGTFTGSVTGNLLGSSSYASASSFSNIAISASYVSGSIYIAGLSDGYWTGSILGTSSIAISASWSSLQNFSTGTYTGSFTGNLLGSSSYALNTLITNISPIYITSGSWTLVSGTYECTYSNIKITNTSFINVVPYNESINTVIAANVFPQTINYNGYVKMFSENLPLNNITTSITIIG
jgi:hypothetical protein